MTLLLELKQVIVVVAGKGLVQIELDRVQAQIVGKFHERERIEQCRVIALVHEGEAAEPIIWFSDLEYLHSHRERGRHANFEYLNQRRTIAVAFDRS